MTAGCANGSSPVPLPFRIGLRTVFWAVDLNFLPHTAKFCNMIPLRELASIQMERQVPHVHV